MRPSNFKKSVLATNIALMLGTAVSMSAVAAEADSAPAADENIEKIEVRGLRASMKASINSKRFSNAVVDAVNAEDIGKFPDNNVAEALGRVPGVTVSKQFGEGSAVSIRGASNALTMTTLNGQNVASTGWYSQQAIDRTFNYSMLPPELIAGMEVYKSSQADLLEGGIGGTVVVNTRKPLDMDSFTVFGSVKGTYSTASEETDPSLSGLVSWKNEDETFGALVALAKSDYSLVRRGNEALPVWGGRIAPTHFEQNRDRTAADVTLQYAPTEELEFGLHYMNLDLAADSVNTQVWIPQDTGNCETNAQGAPIKCTTDQAWVDANGAGGNAYWETRPRKATMKTELVSFDFAYQGDSYKLEAEVGASKATGGTGIETNLAYISGVGGAVGTIDATGDQVDFDMAPNDYQLPSKGEYMSWEGLQPNVVQQPREDKEQYVQADLTFDVDFGAISSIKTGARWSKHTVEQDQLRATLSAYDGAADSLIYNGSDFQDGTLTAGMDGFVIPRPDAGAIYAYTNENVGEWVQDRSGYGELEETNIAAYLMANFEGDGFRGNVGFRYVNTDVEASSYATGDSGNVELIPINAAFTNNINTEEGSYNEVLPSVNIAFDVASDVIVRVSAAQVMSRPNYNDMFNNRAISGYNDNSTGNEAVTIGNPNLSPFKAFQSDLGFEWYYNDASLLAMTYFLKEVNTFTTFTSVPDQQIGLVDPGSGVDSWDIETYVDGQGGRIEGIEFQLQHDMGNGFGGVVNYTFAEATADASNYVDGNDVFSDSSKHTANVVGYYENDSFTARAAYTWRSEYMIRETGFYGAREVQPYGTLDLGLTYDFLDHFTLTADVSNLLEEDQLHVGRDQGAVPVNLRTSDGYPAYSYQGEARYSVGLQFRY
ncbi:TonB-dependent receptor [Shewanella pneumatophori]|uniref:TonB-dependent receptor n=1 Tax=Shewanella pneumatophori TaxID=314092 RepID=A0A9X1ZGE4_9GAMM|nr:TonB-dependent receptor [Shewanella pneumatophori]MCL1138940.1 TonB-dependent receptor [Shewanella pneumatophori]